MYLVYSLLFTCGVLLAAPYYLWRLRGSIRSTSGWRERFGFLPQAFQQAEPGAIWIHAVSVGETLAVVGLVRELQRRYPGRKIFLSHVTPAGRDAGRRRIPEVAGQFFLPLDWNWSASRALERIRPALLVIVETELWPNLLRAARRRGARIVLVNARLSARSFRRYQWVRGFMRRVLGSLEVVCAQSELDGERFRALGAPRERTVVTGNLKFDFAPPRLGEFPAMLRRALGIAGRQPVVVAASTMPGEEALLPRMWAEIQRRHPEALLILAPRHPARFGEVGALASSQGIALVLRTSLQGDERQVATQLASAKILLLDSIGELAGIFELADVVFMGGSLVPTGGHNLLEPAFWAKPIIFGPHMENFRDIARLFLESGAALQVANSEALGKAILELLGDAARAKKLGEAARAVLERERGATDRVLGQLEVWLSAPVSTLTPG
ncbi:MAG: 3-deoxy-D-manno-octulosonic acid transferase [Acidobacteriia bacterium]|nr:3-deoxy-D-manno-octulosonic acid transferase [Terriglobia bacterium]